MNTRLTFPPYSLWVTSAGEGPPVVLVHGLSGSSRWWSRNMDVLAQSHRVYAIDLVGFGRNRRFAALPGVLPSRDDLTALLARFIETLDAPVHLVGHSMGGQIAIALAARRPDLVRSLLLVSSAGMPFELKPMSHVRSLPRPPYGGVSIARVLVPDFLRAGPASVTVAGARVLRADLREEMQALRVPALLVWGANDPLVPLQYGEAMQREIAGSRLEVIERAAHVPMWDAPDAFNRIALEFFGDVESRAPHVPVRGVFSWGITGWTEGVAHRQCGPSRDIVFVHGLGMSSAYFAPFARELYARGWSPAAPDIPGFGESANAPAGSAGDHARVLERWADALSIRGAVWVGHSIGCDAVAALSARRPDIVRRAVLVGPLWTQRSFPSLRILGRLFLDALREPLGLYRYVFRAYWRTGIARWLMTWLRFAPGLDDFPRIDAQFIAGERDPIPDMECRRVAGAHACVFSHPAEVADLIGELTK